MQRAIRRTHWNYRAHTANACTNAWRKQQWEEEEQHQQQSPTTVAEAEHGGSSNSPLTNTSSSTITAAAAAPRPCRCQHQQHQNQMVLPGPQAPQARLTCVPLPWCTSQSRMSTRSAPAARAARAAMAALLKKQKPMAVLLSAWWPGDGWVVVGGGCSCGVHGVRGRMLGACMEHARGMHVVCMGQRRERLGRAWGNAWGGHGVCMGHAGGGAIGGLARGVEGA